MTGLDHASAQDTAEIYLFTNRNSVLSNEWNCWFELARGIDSSGTDLHQPEIASHIEPQRRQIVIRRRQPEPLAILGSKPVDQRVKNRRSSAGVGRVGIERNQFSVVTK